MKPKSFLVSTVLCLSMLTGARAGSAQQIQPLEPEWLARMYAEGWQKVQEGVLRRDTGGGEHETFSYGAEGLQWVVQGYEQQVGRLGSRYDAAPSEELAAVIDQLQEEIRRLEESLQEASSAESFDGAALESCTLSYGGDASAGPQSGTRGVTAQAHAWYHSDCGSSGDTFATAYAHAIEGAGERTITHSDPKNGGTWIDSNASASVNGSSDCHSWAQGSVSIPQLDIYFQTPLRENFRCSRPPLQLDPNRITLDGPQSDGDPRLLADEQSVAGDPRAGDRNQMTTNWGTIYVPHVNAAILDLGAVYRIERIYLYDSNNMAYDPGEHFTVSAGSASAGWTQLISDPLSLYLEWKGFPNDSTNDGWGFVDDPALEFSGVTTRYLRVVNPTGYLGMSEIVVYGTLVSP